MISVVQQRSPRVRKTRERAAYFCGLCYLRHDGLAHGPCVSDAGRFQGQSMGKISAFGNLLNASCQWVFMTSFATHIYADSGNAFVAALVPETITRLLDIGCGSGDTAHLVKARAPQVSVEGVTFNSDEAAAAARKMDRVHVLDIETALLDDLPRDFDCLRFSHVLEHMRDPGGILEKVLPHLRPGGVLLIAVPNVLEWRTRLRFLRGDFSYADTGVLDRTHLRFFTFDTAEVELFSRVGETIAVERKLGEGAIPLGPLRRIAGIRACARRLDRVGVRWFPNLFAQQIILIARKREPRA